ncbi:hypothetical protein [Halalkalibacter urbisdiaboli]|uniref:hypothetical protein n=1 Tax=Halalkalibacter urbisdiaboli TaxID=1960589 RepID=UPI000B43EBD3|nr:hypothetical protein [Halalkalibacter urbisdiaboli]
MNSGSNKRVGKKDFKIIIEPDIYVGDREPLCITDQEFCVLLKHYQGIMFEKYCKDIKRIFRK